MLLFLFYLYYFIGFLFIINNYLLAKWYIAVLLYFTFKWLFNYRKCTISYFECLLRRVKKEEGILFNLLEESVNIRYTKHIYLFYLFSIAIFIDYFYIKQNKFNL